MSVEGPTMPIRTKRWDQPRQKRDGIRILICRYRPRALRKENETWDVKCHDLGPSKELHAAFYGKNGPPITWEEYRQRYLAEMQAPAQQELIDELAAMVREGKTITLLCSSACEDESHCHRSLLKQLIEERLAATTPAAEQPAPG
jgi:uncharacterized protein YeaO (DUF488 family)